MPKPVSESAAVSVKITEISELLMGALEVVLTYINHV